METICLRDQINMLKDILLAFIPIFVAVDAVGVLPIFTSITSDYGRKEKLSIILQSVMTATVLALSFIFLGKAIFKFLSITINDFLIAGGSILFCIAITDLLNPVKKRRIPSKELGSVPLGTPLIVGPAVLATCMLSVIQYGIVPTLISVITNILFAGVVFMSSDYLIKFLGEAGSKALSKIISLLLAAIAVMMVRKGFFGIIEQYIAMSAAGAGGV